MLAGHRAARPRDVRRAARRRGAGQPRLRHLRGDRVRGQRRRFGAGAGRRPSPRWRARRGPRVLRGRGRHPAGRQPVPRPRRRRLCRRLPAARRGRPAHVGAAPRPRRGRAADDAALGRVARAPGRRRRRQPLARGDRRRDLARLGLRLHRGGHGRRRRAPPEPPVPAGSGRGWTRAARAPPTKPAERASPDCYHRAPMSDRPRFYLTTSIAYANNKPGIHTLYEVIGADAIARWHRMLGDDTRFLTGTDEHSINIAQAAVDEGRPTREFVDEKVALFHSSEAALGIAAGPLHPDHRPRPRPRRPGDGPPGLRQRRHLPRHLRGLVLPERGLPERHGRHRDRPGDDLPEPPGRPAPVADRAELVLQAVELPGAPRAALRRAPRVRPARLPAQRDARVHPQRPRGLLDQPRADARATGASRSRSARTARRRSSPTARGTRRPARSTSGTTRSSTTSRAPASRTTRRPSRAGGRPTCT